MAGAPEEFRFFALNKKAAWDQGKPVGLYVSNNGIEIKKATEYKVEKSLVPESLPDGSKIIDFALGQCGVVYVLDCRGGLWIFEPGWAQFERVNCLDKFLNPQSITYVPGTLVIASAQEEPPKQSILALARVNWQIRWEAQDRGLPIGADQKGNLYILKDKKVSVLNAGGVDVTGNIKLANLTSAAISNDGLLYAFEDQNNSVLKIDLKDTAIIHPFLQFKPEEVLQGLDIDAKGNCYIGCHVKGKDKYLVRKFSPKGIHIGDISVYGGPVKRLVVDQEGRLYLLTSEEKPQIVVFKPETGLAKPKQPGSQLPKGTYYSKAFDSTEAGTKWHKIVLDADIPENTQINVSCFSSDRREQTDKDIHENPDSLDWSTPLINPKDALIMNSAGRYLWLRIELTGSGQLSPLLRNICVYFPRMSYLRYLPAVYQEDEHSREFLERFLSLFETFFFNLEWEIGHIARYFDADAVSGDFLRWIGAWLSVPAGESWPEKKLRQLIKRAPDLYKKRGTRRGLEEMLELYTGNKPFIVEYFQFDCIQEVGNDSGEEYCLHGAIVPKKPVYSAKCSKDTCCLYTKSEEPAKDKTLSDLLKNLYGSGCYSFCVLINPVQETKNGRFKLRRYSENEIQTVRHIVKVEKPAHTEEGIVVLQPWICLDQHTYLGVNTCLSEPVPALDTGSVMPRDTVLSDPEKAGQAGLRARLGMDITLT